MIEDILEQNNCDPVKIGSYTMVTENDSRILAINDNHEAVFKQYPRDCTVVDGEGLKLVT